MLPRPISSFSKFREKSARSGGTLESLEEPHWTAMIPGEQWSVYTDALNTMRSTSQPFLLGGGFALANYTQRWRNTKDIDFYVLPQNRQDAIDALTAAGFVDYHSSLPYDRGWIYRSTKGGVIVDLIWSMANRRALVDEEWFEHAAPLKIRQEILYVLPIEELLWSKLYVIQHDHCDWPDLLNLLHAQGVHLDWEHLLKRVNGDVQLLKALCTLFDWLCPESSEAIPKTVRSRLKLPKPEGQPESEHDRIRLLDSRAWFAARLNKDQQLEI